MKYTEAIAYMESLSSYGIVPGLGSVSRLCERLGNPQKDLAFVHIAGTNGKGSVLAYVSTVLKCAGYQVGRYISPTIFEYRERFQVGGRPITQKAFCSLTEQVKEVCDQIAAEGYPHPTPFEAETAMAFLYFRQQGCDVVVLETGMGGLEDATNIIENTKVAVLASISMDHMAYLGDTLGKIAAQKAGIIKPGAHIVTTIQETEAMEAILATAESVRRKALSESAEGDAAIEMPLRVADPAKAVKVRYGLEKQQFDYKNWKKLEISLAGVCQIQNAVLAIEVLESLKEQGYEIPEKALRKGLKETQWPGRFTVIGRKPYFVVDGAHNEDAAIKLAKSIEFYFTNKRIVYIMGVLRDKEYEKIIRLTHGYADWIITVTPPGNKRALSALELAAEISKVHPNVTAVDSLEEAVEVSSLLTGREDVIIAFGSLSFLGRLTEIAEKRKKS